jgi:anti-sigma factor RsiW
VACEDNQDLLQAYLDGELDVVRSLEFEQHAKTCGACAADLRSQLALRQAMRGANLRERAPEALRLRVLAAIPQKAEVTAVPSPRQRGESPRNRALEWLAVAAAIAIAFFGGTQAVPYLAGRQQQNVLAQEIVAGHIRSLQPGHLMDVESTDQHTVKPWFDGRVDFAPPVVDLKDQGYPLIGGRLDYVGQVDAAALVYQRAKHLINVFVWPDAAGTQRLPAAQTIQGYNLICWRHGGMDFCASSDLNTTELGDFTRLLQQ